MPQAARIINLQDRFLSRSVPISSRSTEHSAPSPRRRASGQIVTGRYRIGALYKQPSGCWAARITDLVEGRTFKRSSGTGKKGDALKALEAILSRPEPEEEITPPPTFRELVAEFLAVREPEIRPTTKKDYRDVSARLNDAFGSTSVRREPHHRARRGGEGTGCRKAPRDAEDDPRLGCLTAS